MLELSQDYNTSIILWNKARKLDLHLESRSVPILSYYVNQWTINTTNINHAPIPTSFPNQGIIAYYLHLFCNCNFFHLLNKLIKGVIRDQMIVPFLVHSQKVPQIPHLCKNTRSASIEYEQGMQMTNKTK